MIAKYTIKNFRVFDEKGVTVDIKPITILTGCNSSGKSSIVKSMVLLDTYIQSVLDDYNVFHKVFNDIIGKYKLDFTKDTISSLGSFKRVVHSGSEVDTMTFQYQVHSLLLGEDVLVSFTFGTDENDLINQGYLRSINISTISGDVFYSSAKGEPTKANYNLILNSFYRFVYGQFLAYMQDEYKYKRFHLYGLQTEEEFHNSLNGMYGEFRKEQEEEEISLRNFKSSYEDFKKSYFSSYGKDSLADIEKWMANSVEPYYYKQLGISANNKRDQLFLINYTNGHPEIIDISLKWNTLFYFPLLEKLNNVDSNSFKEILIKMLDGATNEKEVLFAIDKISDDFMASGEKTFGDYYRKKEVSFLNFTSNHPSVAFPCIVGVHDFFRIYGEVADNVFLDESYLRWTRRILGPGFEIKSDGTYISTIGVGEVDDWKKLPVSFPLIYDVLLNISHLLDDSESAFYTIKDGDSKKMYHEFEHRLFKMFIKYTSMFHEEIVTSALPHNLSYLGTSLVNVKRDYSFDTNDAFSILIKKYVEANRKNSKLKKDSSVDNSFINRWVKKLGIGHSIQILPNPSGSSYTIRLFKNAEDSVGTILAEEGYGITQLVTLLIRVEIAILDSKRAYIDFFSENEKDYEYVESTIAIEEPEVHLHPKLQSLLAEMFVDAYKNYNVHFIIETHSEYLIRKLQTLIANKEIANKDLSIVYFYAADVAKRPLYTPQVKMIGVEEDGRLNDSFGEGFFDEADRLSMSLLNIKVTNDEKKK